MGGCISLVVHGTETGIGIDPRAWQLVGRLLRREQLDVLHVHEPLMPLVPWCATWRSGAPIVATFHTHREHGHRFYPLARPLVAPLMRRVAKRLAVSTAARDTVARYFPGEYTIVPNGIDVEHFARPAPRPADMPPGRPHVLYVGRLEPRKGLDHLVDAIALVRCDVPDVRLVIVGSGPDRGALIERARVAGVDALFAGAVTDEQLPAFYQAADVLCAPATFGESFGIVLLEAMAAGCPVVASSIEGYVGLVGNAECGARIVPAGDAAALAREVAALVADAPLRARLGAKGARFADTIDWTVIARRLQTIYEDVLATASQRRDPDRQPHGQRDEDAGDHIQHVVVPAHEARDADAQRDSEQNGAGNRHEGQHAQGDRE